MECYATPWRLWRAVVFLWQIVAPSSLLSLILFCLFGLNDYLPARASKSLSLSCELSLFINLKEGVEVQLP